MAEYIEREAVNALIKAECSPKVAAYLIDAVATIPAADVRPVVKAKWEENKRGSYCVVCSNCGFGFPTGFVWYDCNRASDEREFSIMTEDADLNFCPNCGADLRLTSMSGANGEEI